MEQKQITNMLADLIGAQKEISYKEPSRIDSNDALGVLIAKALKHNGQDIFETMKAAFEDSNFHSFNERLSEIWEEEEERQIVSDRIEQGAFARAMLKSVVQSRQGNEQEAAIEEATNWFKQFDE